MRLQTPRRQQGLALAISLILLVVVTVLAVSAVRFTSNELRIATNEQLRVSAAQISTSVADAAVADSNNTPVIGDVGYRVCTAGVSGCNRNTVTLPNSFMSTEITDGDVVVEIERQAPLLGPPPRGIGSSLSKFAAAYFQVGATYNEIDEGLGFSAVNQGVVVLVPANN